MKVNGWYGTESRESSSRVMKSDEKLRKNYSKGLEGQSSSITLRFNFLLMLQDSMSFHPTRFHFPLNPKQKYSNLHSSSLEITSPYSIPLYHYTFHPTLPFRNRDITPKTLHLSPHHPMLLHPLTHNSTPFHSNSSQNAILRQRNPLDSVYFYRY